MTKTVSKVKSKTVTKGGGSTFVPKEKVKMVGSKIVKKGSKEQAVSDLNTTYTIRAQETLTRGSSGAQETVTKGASGKTIKTTQEAASEKRREINNFLNEIDGDFQNTYGQISNTRVNGTNSTADQGTSSSYETATYDGTTSQTKTTSETTRMSQSSTVQEDSKVSLVGGKIVKTTTKKLPSKTVRAEYVQDAYDAHNGSTATNLHNSSNKTYTDASSKLVAGKIVKSKSPSTSEHIEYVQDGHVTNGTTVDSNVSQSSSYETSTYINDGGTTRQVSSKSAIKTTSSSPRSKNVANDSKVRLVGGKIVKASKKSLAKPISNNAISSPNYDQVDIQESTIVSKVHKEVIDIVNVNNVETFDASESYNINTYTDNYTIDGSVGHQTGVYSHDVVDRSGIYTDETVRRNVENYVIVDDSVVNRSNVDSYYDDSQSYSQNYVDQSTQMNKSYVIDDNSNTTNYNGDNFVSYANNYSTVNESANYTDLQSSEYVMNESMKYTDTQSYVNDQTINEAFKYTDVQSYANDHAINESRNHINDMRDVTSYSNFANDHAINESLNYTNVSDMTSYSNYATDHTDTRYYSENYATTNESNFTDVQSFSNTNVNDTVTNYVVDESILNRTDLRSFTDKVDFIDTSVAKATYDTSSKFIDESVIRHTDVYVDERTVQESSKVETVNQKVIDKKHTKRQDNRIKTVKEQCICEICTCG